MNYVLEKQELTKMYGNTTVVNRVSMHVPEGKIYGLLGRNGAGKTTTMKMLLRMIRITNGKVVLFGKEKNNRKDYQKIGSIIETPAIPILPSSEKYTAQVFTASGSCSSLGRVLTDTSDFFWISSCSAPRRPYLSISRTNSSFWNSLYSSGLL